MFELAMTFANMEKEDCTAKTLLKIMATNGIYKSIAGHERGFETHFVVNKNYFFFTEENNKLEERIKENRKDIDEMKFYFPSDKKYCEFLWEEVKTIKEDIKEWLDYSIYKNGINFEKAKEFLEKKPVSMGLISNTENPWQPQISMYANTNSLKDYIISHDFIWPIYEKRGYEFERIRRCPYCGTYFYAKDVRKTFCSDKCKCANHYSKKIQAE